MALYNNFRFIHTLVLLGVLLEGQEVFNAFSLLIGATGSIKFLHVSSCDTFRSCFLGVKQSVCLRKFLQLIASKDCCLIGGRFGIDCELVANSFYEYVPAFRTVFLRFDMHGALSDNLLIKIINALLNNYCVGNPEGGNMLVRYFLSLKCPFMITGKNVPAYLQALITHILERNQDVAAIEARKAVMSDRFTEWRLATNKRKRHTFLCAQHGDLEDPNAPAADAAVAAPAAPAAP